MNIAVDQDYIRVIDSVLEPEFCAKLITGFHKCKKWQTRVDRYQHLWTLNLAGKNTGPMTAMDIMKKTTAHVYDWSEDLDLLVDCVYTETDNYISTWDRYHSFPKDFTMEGFRLKYYMAGSGDGFPIHCDSSNKEMSSRFLAFLFYLNDSDAPTEFPQQNITVEARQGRLLMFPPGLQWPHIGHEPKIKDKYILSTYLHFI